MPMRKMAKRRGKPSKDIKAVEMEEECDDSVRFEEASCSMSLEGACFDLDYGQLKDIR